MTDPLERIAVVLEKALKFAEQDEARQKQIEIDNKGIEYYKIKYDELWKKHQELLRELLELKK